MKPLNKRVQAGMGLVILSLNSIELELETQGLVMLKADTSPVVAPLVQSRPQPKTPVQCCGGV